MENKSRNFIKKCRRFICLTIAMAVVFVECFSHIGVIKTKAAGTTKDNDKYQFMDYETVCIDALTTPNQDSEFTMRRKSAIYTLNLPTGRKMDDCNWTSLNEEVVKVKENPKSLTPTLEAQKAGTASIRVEVSDKDADTGNNKKTFTFSFRINVAFSISEYLELGASAKIKKIFSSDSRRAIIMDMGAELPIGGPSDSDKNLKLVYGDATDPRASWTSSDSDVIDTSENNKIKAVSAGNAKLTVSYLETDNTTLTDTIDVYVRPTKLTYKDNDINDGDSKTVDKGDEIGIFVGNNKFGYKEGLSWYITKGVDGDQKVIRDSGATFEGEDTENVNLTYIENANKKAFKIDCKAGTYDIYFCVNGTYKGVNRDCKPIFSNACAPVRIRVTVKPKWENKNITLNVGGSYNLSDALNIPSDLLGSFNVRPKTEKDESLVRYSDNKLTALDDIGTATYAVSITSDPEGISLGSNKNIEIVINIVHKFSLNRSDHKMAVGSTVDLYGVISPDPGADPSQFKWSLSGQKDCVSFCNSEGQYISNPEGQYVTVKAIKKTDDTIGDGNVVVTLEWKNSQGIVRSASCSIIVRDMPSSFKIDPSSVQMEAGTSQNLYTDLTGQRKIVWMSSDTSIVTVSPQAGNISAKITAKNKTGEVVITAYNEDNQTYATCRVRVISTITSITIDKGLTYTAALASQYVFMKAIWQPSNATETELKWESSNPKVATVDKNGMVTLLSLGQTYIRVKSVENEKASYDCLLTVTDRVMDSIKTDVTNLDMIKGETHQVIATYTPTDASEIGMTWTSLDTKVAKVSNTGLITAVGVGSTSIVVKANVAYDTTNNPNKFAEAVININVRNKLNSIKFAAAPIYIAAGNSQKIDVVFNPAKDVNTNLTWSVSDTSIIKVSKDGVLTGVAPGIASLNVIAEDIGGAGISTHVYVTPKPVYATDFVLSPDKETIHVGDVYTLEKSFSPSEVTETNLTWDTSDANIATVDEGVVTAKAVGEVVISAVYTDAPNGKPITRSCSFKVEPPIVYATDFSVSPASENILVGGTFNINPVFTPTDTTNKNVDYQSLDTGVATVDNNGVVTGVGAGDVLIVCVAEDGGFRSECAVHVENAIQFSLNPSVRELAVGHSFTPVKVTKPSNASKTAKWKSSNTAIATVDSKGKVKGKRIGTCTITCTLTNYNQSAKCTVKVRKLNSKVKFDKTNIRIGVGQTYTIKRTVWSNASTTPKLSWKTSNKRILTVNSSGKIKGIRVGLAKITAITKDKIHAKAVCNVRVIRRAKSIGLNTDYMVLYVGRSKTLTARFRPSNATVKKVKWTSGNSKIARVTGSGKVRGISVGDTYITATATDGSNKKAKCYVKVLEAVPATSIVVAQKDMTMKRGDSAKLSFTVLPSDTSDGLKFSSNNKRVATINSKGVVHAVGTGDAEITILTTSGITANVNINVVALNKKSIKMRQYDSETLTVFGAKNTVTWYSSNKRVATVDNNGLVVGKGKGTAYIYAYVNGCKLGCKVTITSVNS